MEKFALMILRGDYVCSNTRLHLLRPPNIRGRRLSFCGLLSDWYKRFEVQDPTMLVCGNCYHRVTNEWPEHVKEPLRRS